MGTAYEAAAARLKAQEASGKKAAGRYSIIVKPVISALIGFCRQDEEFARAVAEDTDKTLEGLFKAITKNIGNSISDIEVFRRAAKYYFPTASVRMLLEIRTNGENEDTEEKDDNQGGIIPDVSGDDEDNDSDDESEDGGDADEDTEAVEEDEVEGTPDTAVATESGKPAGTAIVLDVPDLFEGW